MNNETVELVQFRLKAGVAAEAFLAAAADSQAALARLPGFLARELLHGEDGLWIDVVHWRSKAEALAAAAAFGAMPEAATFGAMIDETALTMLHLDQVRRFA